MSLPISPTNGQTAVLNGVTYSYNSTSNSWTRVLTSGLTAGNILITGANVSSSTTTGALVVTGGAGIGGTLYAGGIVASGVDLVANAATQDSKITGANAAIVTANTAMKLYSDAQDALITSAWTANAQAVQSQLTGANAAIVTANTALKSYVDTQDSAITTAWQANAATQDSKITGANAAIVTANTALKSYVDTQDSAITSAWTANAATQQGQITTLQGQVYTNSNVAAYLPTYTGNVSAGNVNVTANIYATGNIFSAGSRILTAADLQTITYVADYITMDPTSVSGLTTIAGTSTSYGTYNFGNVTSIQTYGDYDTVANTGFYSVNDATGAPGHVEYIGFSNVAGFNRLNYNINYTASSGHTIDFDLYNYQYGGWDTFATTSGSGSWQSFSIGIIDDAPYIGTGANVGKVTTRLYHLSSGNVQHRTWIDYVGLDQSVTGGQGPRGVTGATGATGAQGPAWAGGYVANVTTFGSNLVANSATASTNTSTGALVVIGGAGISGTIYSGGIVANGIDLVANAAAIQGQLTGANAAIVTANTAMKSYSDAQDALITSAWTANAATTQSQLAGANAAIITANTAMKGYVDTQFTNIVGGAPAALDTLYEIANSLGNNASLSATLINSISGANAAIVTANTSLKSYVDDRDTAVTAAWTANAATQQGLIATLQTQVYSNTNVAAYIPTYTGAITSLSISSASTSTSTSTGALVVAGGAGIAGNVYAGTVYTTGLRWSGNGNVMQTGGGGKYTVATTAPSSPAIGDTWYNSTSDVVYEYRDVGTGTFWIDVSGATMVSTNAAVASSAVDSISPFLLMGA
jgi:hypothetical protein